MKRSLLVLSMIATAFSAVAQDADNPMTTHFVSTAPVQDGAIGASEYPAGALLISRANSLDEAWAVFPEDAADDISFTIYTAWDSDGLYFGLDVSDDTLEPGFDGEFLQIVLAPANATGKTGSLADFTFESTTAPMGLVWRDNAGGGDDAWSASAGIEGAFAPRAGGYVLEVKLPWSDFPFALPALEANSQFRFMITAVDREGGESNFVISSGVNGRNPFENHEDLSLLTLGEAEGPVTAGRAFHFCDGMEGWASGSTSANVDWAPGYLVQTYNDVAPFDPIANANYAYDADAVPYVHLGFTTVGIPDGRNNRLFFFPAAGGHGFADFASVSGGNVLDLDMKAIANAGFAAYEGAIANFRLDLPDNGVADDKSTSFAYIDYVVVDDQATYTLEGDGCGGAAVDPADLDGDGLDNNAEAALGTSPVKTDSDGDGLGDGSEVNIQGTNPANADTDGDGVSDGTEVELGTDPLDPDDFPQVPAVNPFGLALVTLMLAASAVLVLRRRECKVTSK